MSKIVLKQVYLLNWYGFIDKTIPIGSNLSLITGENECGKSTVLDAIKYCFIGDTDFNKATSATRVGQGKRTISSYARCLTDPDKKEYARPSSEYPNIYTHIAMEYHNELYDTNFVLGVIIETNSSDNTDNFWYALDNKTLKDISFFEIKDNKKYVLSSKAFRDTNKAELLPKSDGIVKFMTMTGLKLQGKSITTYQRKLKSIMTYNPEAKIQQFIKESVLEDKNIKLSKLKEAKDSIDEITASFEIIEKEISDLDKILEAYNDYNKVNSRLIKDDIKKEYKELLSCSKNLDYNLRKLNENKIEIERLSSLLNTEEKDKEDKNRELNNANRQLDEVDGSKAIKDEQDKLNKLLEDSNVLKKEINKLEQLNNDIRNYLTRINKENKLLDFTDKDISYLTKTSALYNFKEEVNKLHDTLIYDKRKQEDSLQDTRKQISDIDAAIRNYDRNLPDYSKVENQRNLIKEINNKFKELNIQTEAKFSFSLVVELKDEGWRNAIESFLGIHRYSILVEEEYFDIANKVMDQSNYKYVELVNTKLLSKKKFDIVDDSLLHQLDIKNEIAKKYFAYWLGRIHGVSLDEVANYENALSKEGKISRNMSVSYLNFKKIDSYCLGEDAIKLNKDRALKQRKSLEKIEIETIENINAVSSKLASTKLMIEQLNKTYDLDANNKYSKVLFEIEECKLRISKLKEALQNNNEYLLLVERISEIEKKLSSLNSLIKTHNETKYRLESEDDVLSKTNIDLNNKIKVCNDKLELFNNTNPNESNDAKKEYDLFINGKKELGDVMIYETRKRNESERNRCNNELISFQSTYNAGRKNEEQIPTGLEYEALYRSRKNRLQVDNLEEIKDKLRQQTRQYEKIFKNEFVLKIKANVDDALNDIKEINKQLRKLAFSTTYQFEVKNVSGSSDYARILDYADYLKKTNSIFEDQIKLTSTVGYDEKEAEKREEEIKDIINRIIAKNNDEMLNNFADYRNYMEYEVIVNNAEEHDSRLSRLAGYNSGAGTQIPYTIILSAALAIIYNARVNSTRLVFIDEPFEKMSDKNIKIMLDFFKSQDFQVIFCAPPNKLDSIGRECDTIIPIKKINKSNMTLGVVKFHGV